MVLFIPLHPILKFPFELLLSTRRAAILSLVCNRDTLEGLLQQKLLSLRTQSFWFGHFWMRTEIWMSTVSAWFCCWWLKKMSFENHCCREKKNTDGRVVLASPYSPAWIRRCFLESGITPWDLWTVSRGQQPSTATTSWRSTWQTFRKQMRLRT